MAPFSDFALDPGLIRALDALGFTEPTPIQEATLPVLLQGRDVIARARTGSGKTYAFGLPLLQRVFSEEVDGVRALVLAPTRELAIQVTEALRDLAPERQVPMITLYGGASYTPQFQALNRGVQVVVATPGRLLDHLDKGSLDLSSIELVVLDEADEMLRMGFIDDVETILAATPKGRQVALFSATMPKPIQRIADGHLSDPVEVGIDAGTPTTDHIRQGWVKCKQREELAVLQRLLAGEVDGTTLIFARTRAGCAEIADALVSLGIAADGLHGDLAQPARERVLGRLRAGRLDVVVATDVASRGIDVDHLTHVIHCDLPPDHETYVHRIGRTGRAGRQGTAISLVTPKEVPKLKKWQRLLKVSIDPVQVPSDAMIRERRLAKLRTSLEEAQEQKGFQRAADFVAETLEADDSWTAERIAAAAIAMLDEQLGISSSATLPQLPEPKPRRERERGGQRNRHQDGPELFFPVGSDRGVRPGDLVGALANECGVPGDVIGKITVVERKSFVQLPVEHLERILAERDSLEIRGNQVPMAKARPRMGPPPGRGRPGGRPPGKRPYKRAPKNRSKFQKKG